MINESRSLANGVFQVTSIKADTDSFLTGGAGPAQVGSTIMMRTKIRTKIFLKAGSRLVAASGSHPGRFPVLEIGPGISASTVHYSREHYIVDQ
jgi:hypothetical protein